MSYLLENSLVVSKEEFIENENLYLDYDEYEIENNYILTQNDKPFFSIYDIASYCKNKFKDEKLFLVVHRFNNNITDEKVTEFYIFNTIDIFEKSLTSFITIDNKDLIKKQKMVQDNILLAQQLSNQKKIHIILGDNIKKHEVIEYVAYPYLHEDIIFFNNFDFEERENNKIYNDFKNNYTNSTVISKIIGKIRIIEPKSVILKRTAILIISVIISILIAQDTTDDLFADKQYKVKKDTKKIKNVLFKLQQNTTFKENIYNKKFNQLKQLKQKDVYVEAKK